MIMKKLLFAITPLAIVAAFSFVTADPLAIGSAMPQSDRKMLDISGKEVTMAEAKRDNGVLVMFSCNTCPYVVKNQERTLAISRFAQAKKLGVVLVNSNEAYRSGEDSYEAMTKYAAQQGYTWNYVVDKDHVVADAFGANRTPEVYLF